MGKRFQVKAKIRENLDLNQQLLTASSAVFITLPCAVIAEKTFILIINFLNH